VNAKLGTLRMFTANLMGGGIERASIIKYIRVMIITFSCSEVMKALERQLEQRQQQHTLT
jgi:hypothetical protein